MYTMVLMMAVGGSADATAFGGRKASCHGGGYTPAYTGCSGSGYMPSYTGCSGYAPAATGCTGSTSCHGSSRGGFLGGLFHRNKGTGCHGASAGCTGYVATPTCCPAPVMAASSGGCFGSGMVSSPVMGGMMAAPCMTAGMPALGVMPAVTNPTPMTGEGVTPGVTPDKMPAATPATPAPAPAPTPDKPAGGTKI